MSDSNTRHVIEAPVGILRGSVLFQPGTDDERKILQASIALCSFHEERGDTCVPLAQYAGQELQITSNQRSISWQAPALEDWIAQLLHFPLISDGREPAALIIYNQHLYLHRLYRHEQQLAALLLRKNEQADFTATAQLLPALKALFNPADDIDWQLLAVVNALCRSFSIISGGPGTGKTTTVAKLITLLLMQDPHTRIVLAAPTGKAATRMSEALRQESATLAIDASVRDAFPQDSLTLHRLYNQLNFDPDQRIDCLIIDEASMADISTLNRVLQCLPDATRIVLLGDPLQLTSVESGSVLMDICDSSPEAFNPAFIDFIKTAFNWQLESPEPGPPLAGARIALKKNWRFEKAAGIKALSESLLRSEHALADLATHYPDCSFHVLQEPKHDTQSLLEHCLPHFLALNDFDDVHEAIRHLSALGILSAWKNGPLGVHAINDAFDQAVRKARAIPQRLTWYHARPFMVQQNNYDLGIYNGDIGIIWECNGVLRAFIDSGAQLKNLPLEDIQDCLPLYAMSIHKSQGSQYDQVHVVIPERHLEHLSRALYYTGITRARSSVHIWSSDAALETCVKQDLQRYTGLPDRLQ